MQFFNTVRYIIGGHAYSLQDIENGVLRANRKGVGKERERKRENREKRDRERGERELVYLMTPGKKTNAFNLNVHIHL